MTKNLRKCICGRVKKGQTVERYRDEDDVMIMSVNTHNWTERSKIKRQRRGSDDQRQGKVSTSNEKYIEDDVYLIIWMNTLSQLPSRVDYYFL